MTIYHMLMYVSLLITVVLMAIRFIGMEIECLDMFDDTDTIFGVLSIENLSWFVFGYSFSYLILMDIIGATYMTNLISLLLTSILLLLKVWMFKKIYNFLKGESNLVRPEELIGLKARTITKVDQNGHGTITLIARGKMVEYIAVSDEVIESNKDVIITEVFGSKLKVRMN